MKGWTAVHTDHYDMALEVSFNVMWGTSIAVFSEWEDLHTCYSDVEMPIIKVHFLVNVVDPKRGRMLRKHLDFTVDLQVSDISVCDQESRKKLVETISTRLNWCFNSDALMDPVNSMLVDAFLPTLLRFYLEDWLGVRKASPTIRELFRRLMNERGWAHWEKRS